MSLPARREAVRAAVPEGLPGIFVTAPANIRYLTGFTGSNGQLWLAEESIFFTDGRYIEQAAAEVADLEIAIYKGGTKLSDLLGKVLAGGGVDRIGVEAAHLTLGANERLSSGLDGVELVGTSDVVEGIRRSKDSTEVDAIRRAQGVAEAALLEALSSFAGGTEADLALAIEWAIRTGGGEGVSFEVIVAGGSHSALPHATPRREPIDLDGVLLIDMGARVDGYCSDMTRTFLGPAAPAEIVSAHRSVLDALEAGCAAVGPGVRCADVDKAARDVLEAEGLGEAFVHSTGHGVGLEIHESPSLTTTSEEELVPGDVVTVEPGTYLAGIGGVRVEDMLVVTEDGATNLTGLDRGPAMLR